MRLLLPIVYLVCNKNDDGIWLLVRYTKWVIMNHESLCGMSNQWPWTVDIFYALEVSTEILYWATKSCRPRLLYNPEPWPCRPQYRNDIGNHLINPDSYGSDLLKDNITLRLIRSASEVAIKLDFAGPVILWNNHKKCSVIQNGPVNPIQFRESGHFAPVKFQLYPQK